MDSFTGFLKALGPTRILAMLGVTVGLIAFFFFVIMRMTQPQMALLYSGLEPEEAATVMQRLDALSVPYSLRDDGRIIMAPGDRVTALRVSLAGEGLGGSIVGYEIFDRGDALGTTSFVQQINRVRAIEGELARTIREINSVKSARVHIAMVERQLFAREERQPSASIIIKTTGGGLSQSQVRAIQHLVAAAVTGLSPESISIVDQRGTLLAKGGGGGEESFSSILSERRVGYERRLRSQIEDLLTRTVGAGRVRAEVAVKMDTSRVTTNSETYDPDSQVARSTTTSEEISQGSDITPGGGGGGGVTIANNLPDAQQPANTDQTSTSSSSTTSETTNFEISRTTTINIKEPGEIQRISVAVLVDGNYTDDGNGNLTYQPRSQAELDQLEALVSSTIGFDADRGDTIEIVNLRFAQIEEVEPGPEPFNLMGLTKDDLFGLLESLVLGVVMILVLLLIVRPLVSRLIKSIPQPAPAPAQLAGEAGAQAAIAGPEQGQAALAAGEEGIAALTAPPTSGRPSIDSEIDVAQVEGKVQDSALKKVGDIVVRHPDEAASIVRTWLYAD